MCVSEVTSSNNLRRTLSSAEHEEMWDRNNEELIDDNFTDDDGTMRYLVRDNTTMSELMNHTAMTSYDKSEWIFVGILMVVVPLVMGLLCANFHR
jgi:exonuclease V gamma subunit